MFRITRLVHYIVRKFGVWDYNSLKTIGNWERARRSFLKPFFLIRSFCTNFSVIILRDIIVLENFLLSSRITMCNLHWCYTFCTGVTLFALVLHLNCIALSQSESSNFFMYIINHVIQSIKLHFTDNSVENNNYCSSFW